MDKFSLFNIDKNTFIDFSNDEYPTILRSWCGNRIDLDDNATHFGFNYHDNILISLEDSKKEFNCYEKMYFSISEKALITPSEKSQGFVVSRLNTKGFFHLGGSIENTGRYQYIDGCSDSLLISPVKLGDPCFNLLHFPKNIDQTPHTHPSLRIGMIVSGQGFCIMENEKVELNAGNLFIIPKDLLHSFKTDNQEMIIVVYHPDTDFGPTDKNHPMINKTIINGVSAGSL